jgi:3D (Asp-Asp-Asp) domain-containing protein
MASPAALKVAGRAIAASGAGRRRRGPGPLAWLLAALVLLPLLLAAPFLAVQAGQTTAGCGGPAGNWTGPGSLGGYQGTGLTAKEVRDLQNREGGKTLPPDQTGRVLATVYAPSFGGINVWNGGKVTAGGIVVNAGAKRAYLIAVDPTRIKLGTPVYVWPNPYGWRGPFIAADTGGAIQRRHIDIYVFGDRATATKTVNSWGSRDTRIAGKPIVSGGPPATGSPADCLLVGDAHGNGRWELGPGANRPGADLTPPMRGFLNRMTSYLPRKLVVCTGTNHSQYTLTGNISDHYAGNGVDLCSSANGFPVTGGGYGDRIAAAAFRAAGYSPSAASAAGRAGGARTVYTADLRVQIIWKSQLGGNHNNHIHVGVAPR